jgi:hypothetical protein
MIVLRLAESRLAKASPALARFGRLAQVGSGVVRRGVFQPVEACRRKLWQVWLGATGLAPAWSGQARLALPRHVTAGLLWPGKARFVRVGRAPVRQDDE